ncbi:YncE family protein [Siccirubricoccus sp. G192]|uniref:lactonase family protein n=1 Tax=Siccirubricoccus sp. G192 TaxID=2849651 RepID=UPI001C2BF787|nr:YncE family protein [Siccirubricoccus sp. G192]MBV1800235.1 YncE family protein [Siccirubricoccus sp. G192]
MKRLLLASAGLAALTVAARAELALSVNDNKLVLENGVTRVVRDAAPDTLSVIDLAANPPALRAEIPVPSSVVGPPLSVAITPDERMALATANQRPDPADPGKMVPGITMAVIDLTANPPRITATVPTGTAPAGVSINRAGTMALVANRAEGTVSIYRIQGGQVTPAGKVEIGTVGSEVSHVAFTPDGRHALVTRYGDHMVNVLQIDGDRVTKLDRQITTGVRPYGLAITPDGRWAVVANIGRGTGDADTVSLIDLQREPFRIVDTVSVGQTPEGIMTSPDSRHVAVTVMNGSNKPADSPFHGPGLVKMLRIDNGRLSVVSEAQVGTWSQGTAFSQDGRTLLVGNMVERNVQVLRVGEDGKLTDTGTRIGVSGGSAALRTAERAR